LTINSYFEYDYEIITEVVNMNLSRVSGNEMMNSDSLCWRKMDIDAVMPAFLSVTSTNIF